MEEPQIVVCAVDEGQKGVQGTFKMPCEGRCGRMLLVSPSSILLLAENKDLKVMCLEEAMPMMENHASRGELEMMVPPGAREEMIMHGIPESEVDAVIAFVTTKKEGQ